MRKRMLSLLLALALLLSLAPAALAGDIEICAPEEDLTLVDPGADSGSLYVVNPLFRAMEDSAAEPAIPLCTENRTVDCYSEAEAVRALRESMTAREDQISLRYRGGGKLDVNTLFDKAVAHTGVETEGDYLLFQYYSYYVSWSGSTYTYQVLYNTTAAQEAEMDAAVAALKRELALEDYSEYGKVRRIYDYIVANVRYDSEHDASYILRHTAYAALINKSCVCQGYALLLYRLLLSVGVDNRIVAGGNHTWNVVALGGSGLYYYADTTWEVTGHGDHKWFLRGSDNFPDHVRIAPYTGAEFCAAYPIDTKDYEQRRIAPPELSLLGMSVSGVSLGWTQVRDAERYELEHKRDGAWSSLRTQSAASFTDATARMGESCVYRVRMKVKGAWTEFSDPMTLVFNPFSDVEGKKTLEYVAWAFNNGIVSGTSATTFKPDAPCTRIQFVMMLWKMHGSPVVAGENPFRDISGTKTTNAILWALDKGIINAGKSFNPDGNITRVNIVMMLWKLAGSPKVKGENPFRDVSGAKTTSAVLWAYQSGITKGTSATTFAPDKDCTRVQLVIFLYKYNGIYGVI